MNPPNRVRCFVEVDGLLHKLEHMNMEIKCHSPNDDYPDVVIEGCLSKKPTKNSKSIKKVIFNDPATIVLWDDGTKTVVKCQKGDEYSKELGLAMAISKKFLGNKGNYNKVFDEWL